MTVRDNGAVDSTFPRARKPQLGYNIAQVEEFLQVARRAYDGTALPDDPPLSSERIRLTAFAMSGAIAALAGCLLVHVNLGFDTQPYAAGENLSVFSMAVVGGVASPFGAILGALYVQGARWFLPVEWQLLSSGTGILLVLLILPGGLGGLALRLRDRLLQRVARDEGIDVAGIAQQRLPAADVTADDKEWMLRKTAERVFFR